MTGPLRNGDGLGEGRGSGIEFVIAERRCIESRYGQALKFGSSLADGTPERRADAEIADVENQHWPLRLACLPALSDKRRKSLDTADGAIIF